MNTPTFLVVGAAKCGTTTVCDLLGDHPDVYMTSPKEPHYFSRLTRYHRLRSWYASLFDGAGEYAAAGEGSTSYTHPHRIDFVAPRVRRVLPECRLIYMVRHPVRRLESDWKMRLREGRVPSSINEAADEHASLITFGLYWKHLQTYRRHFPDDQILVVFLEDFAERPEAELTRILRHIGVNSSLIPEAPNRTRNAAEDYRSKGFLASALRRFPLYDRLRGALPERVARFAKSLFTEPFDPRPDWEDDILSLVCGYFREDSRELLRYCGKPPDFWDLEESAGGR